MSKEEVLKEEQTKVARKYGLGNSLVIGHKPAYFNEAALSAMDTYAASLLAKKESKRMDDGVFLDLLKIMVIFNRIEDIDFGGYSILRPDESKFITDFKEKHKL